MLNEANFFEKPPEGVESEPEEMSPEDLAEMVGQIPALKEMLEERRRELEKLKRRKKSEKNKSTIENLQTEIAELEEEISGREEVEIE
jgi:lipid II:glycine glycyltransferase (peptidoglycan interpeptide bridge formation enzyme)